jgi:hypothetical protein
MIWMVTLPLQIPSRRSWEPEILKDGVFLSGVQVSVTPNNNFDVNQRVGTAVCQFGTQVGPSNWPPDGLLVLASMTRAMAAGFQEKKVLDKVLIYFPDWTRVIQRRWRYSVNSENSVQRIWLIPRVRALPFTNRVPEEVRPVKSEVAIYNLLKLDFGKYISS